MMRQGTHSAFDSLNFGLNSLSLSGRHGPRHSFSEASFAPIHQGVSSPSPNNFRGIQHSPSREHLRSQSAILPDFAGSLDSSFGLLNTPSYGSSSFLTLTNYDMLGHSNSGQFTPSRSLSVQDQFMNVVTQDHQSTALEQAAGLVLKSDLPLNSSDHATS